METKTSTQMATIYGMKSSIAFNKVLVKCGILKTVPGGHYVLADSLRGKGLMVAIDTHFFLPSGIRATKKKAAWTESGQQYVRQRLARLGILPAGEQVDLFGTFTN